MVYLGVVVLAMGIMVPLVIQAESKGKMKEMFTLAIALVILSQLTLWQFSGSLWGIVIALIIFFGGFNLLEATLPSLISKIAPVDKKGTAMGIYTSSQFFGAFLGGVSGGWIYGWFDKDITPIFLLSAGLATVWLMIALGMKRPQVVRTHLLNVGEVGDDRAAEMTQKLREITGVIEVVIIRDDQVAYVKANNDLEDRKVLEEVIATR
jgi:predicted MFS family arabinose efflux permease